MAQFRAEIQGRATAILPPEPTRKQAIAAAQIYLNGLPEFQRDYCGFRVVELDETTGQPLPSAPFPNHRSPRIR